MNFQTPLSVTLGSKISALTKILLVMGAFVLPSNSSFGDTGLISSYVQLTASNTSPSATWYGLEDLGADTINFEGHFLGVFDLGTDSLSLTGGQVNTYKNDTGTVTDVTGADVFYRVYPTGGAIPGFSNLSMEFESESPFIDAGLKPYNGTDDQSWQQSTLTNLLSGLTLGEYTIEVFATSSTGPVAGTNYHSNGGPNYKATFTAVPEPSAFLFGGLVCGVVGMCQTRKQRRSRG